LTPHGLTTLSMPGKDVQISFDFVEQRVHIGRANAETAGFRLEPMAVADFYRRLLATLRAVGVDVDIWPVPVEVVQRTPFDEDRTNCAYDGEQVRRVHRALLSIERVFSRYRGCFVGKSSPVHLFWGAFDLAVTRFSGRLNPTPPEDRIMGAAYSHEVISHGFWPGGDWPGAGRTEEALFYGYAVPEPGGFRGARVAPGAAGYDQTLHEFVLPYEAVRQATDPEATLLDFMQSTYAAAAEAAKWPALTCADPLAPLRRARTAAEVLADHLELAQQRRFDEDIARNFAPDCTVIVNGESLRGHAALRGLAARLAGELPTAQFDYRRSSVADELCLLEWSAVDADAEVTDGVDSFVVRDGQIVAQTMHYTVSPRRAGRRPAEPDARHA
jgi:hypothetical protein